MQASRAMRGAGVWLSVTACTPEADEARRTLSTPVEARAVVGEVAASEAITAAPVVAPEVGAALADGAVARRWLAAGGGSTPEFNQVSIEQDLALVPEVFGRAGGLLLFAGGRGTGGVQEVAEAAGDELMAQLADLFAPRGGRTARYRATTLPVDAAATVDNVKAAVAAATVDAQAEPLLVYLAGHGAPGATPGDTGIDLWGQTQLRATELAATLDAGPRPTRVVITSCFSGGFAELAFVGGDFNNFKKGAARGRCGLFAATAEREASGCDPNPDRAAQQGYGLHFLNALRGLDRDGAKIAVDVDGDGRVSLLEAHTRVRIASAGIDVPTTTSDRWLRVRAAGLEGRSAAVGLVEEEAVISALAELGDEVAARTALVQIDGEMAALSGRVEAASAAEDAAYRRVAGELLARWPVLDDPWHPDFAATLASGRAAISAFLATSEAYAGYVQARADGEAAQVEIGAALGRSARLERLVRAHETKRLAALLKARGGADWRAYEELLACERWVPTLAE